LQDVRSQLDATVKTATEFMSRLKNAEATLERLTSLAAIKVEAAQKAQNCEEMHW